MSKRWATRPRGVRWLVWIAVVVLALAIVWALFVPAADWLARHDVGSVKGTLRETALDNARGRLLTLGAGLFAAGALVFTALNFRLLQRNSEQADQWQRRTYEQAERGQVTDRFTKAIEQLGSEKLDVRIGGIYALERIARDSEKDHPAVMEVLTAFIREHSREPWPAPDPASRVQALSTRPDVRVAATVVGRRDAKRDIQRIDLTGAFLWSVDLTGASLRNALLVGADLTGADLTDADLTGAFLAGAHLSAAHLSRVHLDGADLPDTYFIRAFLVGAYLRSANLSRAHLDGAVLDAAHLDGAVLAGAVLDGAEWPAGTPVPAGWKIDTSRKLLRDPGPGPTEAN